MPGHPPLPHISECSICILPTSRLLLYCRVGAWLLDLAKIEPWNAIAQSFPPKNSHSYCFSPSSPFLWRQGLSSAWNWPGRVRLASQHALGIHLPSLSQPWQCTCVRSHPVLTEWRNSPAPLIPVSCWSWSSLNKNVSLLQWILSSDSQVPD